MLGNVSVSSADISTGNNTVALRAVWDPFKCSGEVGNVVGNQLLSDFVSGRNISIAVQAHSTTFPGNPTLSAILSRFKFIIPAPKLPTRKGEDSGTKPHFIEAATVGSNPLDMICHVLILQMHLLSSTAEFLVRNPFDSSMIMIRKFNGTAMYNGSVVAEIDHQIPFAVNPGDDGYTLSPRIPVDWSLGSVGYEALKKALGGQLAVDAVADCEVGIEDYVANIHYDGKGIGAKVRL